MRRTRVYGGWLWQCAGLAGVGAGCRARGGGRGVEAVRREPGAPPFTARGRRPHPGYGVTPLRSYGATARSFLFCFNSVYVIWLLLIWVTSLFCNWWLCSDHGNRSLCLTRSLISFRISYFLKYFFVKREQSVLFVFIRKTVHLFLFMLRTELPLRKVARTSSENWFNLITWIHFVAILTTNCE